jgi:hypothetical protein
MPAPRARTGPFLLIVAAAIVLPGCGQSPSRTAPRPAPELPAVTLDTPENAARSALLCLQAELRASANHDEKTAAAALERLEAIVATDETKAALSRVPQFETLLGEDLIDGYIHNWGSTIAYYAEGLQLERMRRVTHTSGKVAVVVPATGPEDDALIQVTCVRGDGDGWHVSRIEFITKNTTSAPAPPLASEP